MALTEVLCPTCRRPTAWQGNHYRPFCSERCRLRDLGDWASERYRIPGAPDEALPEEDGDREDKAK